MRGGKIESMGEKQKLAEFLRAALLYHCMVFMMNQNRSHQFPSLCQMKGILCLKSSLGRCQAAKSLLITKENASYLHH